MKAKHSLLITLVALLALLITACQMPASTPPPSVELGTETPDSGFPRPEDVTDPMESLIIAATQTALAAESGAPVVVTYPPPAEEQPTGEGEAVQQESGDQEQGGGQGQGAQEQSSGGDGLNIRDDVPVPTPGAPESYTLQAGEFPFCLARRFDVNPQDMLALNGLGLYSTVRPGQTLSMPQSGSFPGERELIDHPDTYTVQAGDTIYSIACAYGDVDPVYMARVNRLKKPYTVEVGQEIYVP